MLRLSMGPFNMDAAGRDPDGIAASVMTRAISKVGPTRSGTQKLRIAVNGEPVTLEGTGYCRGFRFETKWWLALNG